MSRGNIGTSTRRKPDTSGTYATSLTIPNSKRLNIPIILVTYLPSVVAGIGMWFSGWQISHVSDFIAGVAVIAGFLFALLVFVFQLRLQVSHDPRVQQRIRVPVLVDELFSTALLATGVAVAFTVILIIASSSAGTADDGTQLALARWLSSLIAAMGALLCSLLLVVGLKTSNAYRTASNGTEISA